MLASAWMAFCCIAVILFYRFMSMSSRESSFACGCPDMVGASEVFEAEYGDVGCLSRWIDGNQETEEQNPLQDDQYQGEDFPAEKWEFIEPWVPYP
ncbi:hypothetical protein RHMOL_Rhmol03G0138500 [Rhododendron molle]|uniref:Uncharacterized protein n=1 Tax=Rhododendron molle TaxID=49168 RepID=A0ACC0PE21_RHOML|nr:hypothetical protein RHMOL_Rhmol03G0138500 [Rhododendron molle]